MQLMNAVDFQHGENTLILSHWNMWTLLPMCFTSWTSKTAFGQRGKAHKRSVHIWSDTNLFFFFLSQKVFIRKLFTACNCSDFGINIILLYFRESHPVLRSFGPDVKLCKLKSIKHRVYKYVTHSKNIFLQGVASIILKRMNKTIICNCWTSAGQVSSYKVSEPNHTFVTLESQRHFNSWK